MLDELPIGILKGISGSLYVSENGKKTLQMTADGNDKIIDIVDFSFNVPLPTRYLPN